MDIPIGCAGHMSTPPDRSHGWEPGDGDRGTVAVTFHDERGARHDVPSTVTHACRHHPLFAVYEPGNADDPKTFHIGVPHLPDADRHPFVDN